MIRVIQPTTTTHKENEKRQQKILSMFYEGINLYNDGWNKRNKEISLKVMLSCWCALATPTAPTQPLFTYIYPAQEQYTRNAEL